MKQILQQFTLRASLLVMLLVGAVGSAWGETKTVSMTSFTAVSGNVGGDTNISYAAAKGGASTAPAVNNGQIRVYQNGGTFTITANNGAKINSVTLGSAMATTVTYSVDDGTASSNQSINENATITVGSLNCSSVLFTCTGTDKNSRLYVNSLSVTYTSSGSIPTYSVTFDAGEGTFVGNTDFPTTSNTKEVGEYALPSATRNGYTFRGWVSEDKEPVTGNYTLSSDVDFTASYLPEGQNVLSFDFKSNPGGWPTTNSTTLTNYTYTLNGVDYTFALSNVKCNNGYLMLTKPAVLGLPALDGYKLTKVVASNSNSCSTSTRVGISSSATEASYITGGASQTWNMTGSTYTYNLSSTEANTMYYLYVTSANAQLFNLNLTYEAVDESAPQLSAGNVDIAYDATNGSIAYTLTNSVDGGIFAANTSANWLTIGTTDGNTVPFTCSANEAQTERTATVILTYTYNTNETVTKEVTVTQAAAPVVYSTIPALFAAASTTETEVKVTFNNWVVSGVSTNGKNVFVTDNAGNGFVIFDNDGGMNESYPVGSILSGTAISCHLLKYNGFAEIKNLNASDLTITTGGTITASDIALADLAGVNTGALVSYENLTCSVSSGKYYLSDGTTTIQVFNSLFAFNALEEGKTYNITGIYQQFNDTKEILPRSAADIQEVTVTSTLSWTVGTNIELFVFDAADQNNQLSSPANVTAGTEILVSVDAAEGYVLESLIVDGEDVTSQVDETGAYTFTMPDHAVTISATATQGSITPVTDGKYVKVTSTNVLASGQYLIVYEDDGVAFNGSLETLDAANNTISVNLNNTEIAVTTETTAAEFTIDISAGTIKSASGYYIGRTTDSNGMNSSATEKYTNTISMDDDGNAVIQSSGSAYMRYNATSGQDRFRYFKSSTYTSQKAIQLYKKVEVTVGSVGYTTFVAPADVSFSEGVEAFIVTAISTNSIHMEPVTAVPSGTPVVVRASEGTHELSVVTETDDVTDNLLLASDGNVTGNGTIYALGNKSAGVGFYPVKSDAKVPAGKAYLVVNNENIKEFFSFDFGGLVTEINNVNTNVNANAEIYNLAGQRVKKAQKGFYIIDGKKVLVK